MSAVIEVPGEANPLSYETLCRALHWAHSNEQTQRHAAGQQITAWEQQPGYYSSLQAAYLDKSLPFAVRFLAIIQLKNGIDRYWRAYAQTKAGIQRDEKNLMRSRLFQGTVDEPESTLGLHNALVIAKVIRVDYPQDWPEALPSIIDLLRSKRNDDQRQLGGVLQILLRVVKEMGTARLRKSQTALQSITPELVYVLAEIYAEKSAAWITFLSQRQGSEHDAVLAMENSLSALKTLRRLVVMGYEMPHNDPTVEQFWTVSQNQFGQLLDYVNNEAAATGQVAAMVGRHLIQFTKMHIEMSEQHPASFVFLPNSLPLVRAYWDLIAKFAEVFEKSGGIRHSTGANSTKAKAEGPLIEKLAVKGLLLLRACVRIAFQPIQTFKYRTKETKAEQERARSIIKSELLKDELVVEMVNSIITHLFVFRTSDLEAWEEEPEEWEQQEQSEGLAYEWEVRPCAERLFLDLLTNFRALIGPPLLKYFETAQAPNADIATKEAVYTAMGLAAAHVVNMYDFNAILPTTIVNDAQQTGGLYKVLRRRLAILISQWAPVKLTEETRPIVYQIFCHFLNPADETNDLVVRITAARQLRWIADEIDFDVDAFLPYTSNVLGQLVELIQNVEIDEVKLAILESIRILVQRMEDQVSNFGDQLMSTLPKVWENSATEEYMIKQGIIAIFAALVMSMGSDSQRYQSFMMPLLAEAARPGSDLHVHLIDETLELWNAILMQSSPPLSQDVLNLVDAVLPLLEYGSETATEAMVALDSYVLLAPASLLEAELRQQVLTALSGALESRSREQVRMGTVCTENLIRAATQIGGAAGVSAMLKDMIETGFMKKIMSSVYDAWQARQTTGPNKKVSKLSTVTERDYFSILSRLALAEPSLFAQMLASFGPIEQVWPWLSDEWFYQLSGTDHLGQQKLQVLGLTRLLELSAPMQEVVLGKLQDYFEMWASVINELQEGVPSGPEVLLGSGQEETTIFDTPKSLAAKAMENSDPVYTVPTLGFVQERLRDVVSRVGGEGAFQEQWASNVDNDLIAKFQMLTRGGQQ